MKIKRTIPPGAAPIDINIFLHGICGLAFPQKYITNLEKSLKSYFGVKHVFLVSSGKAALTVILKALHALAPDKQEVLIPAYTCFSVPSAIVRSGLTVSLCDVDPSTLDFDYQSLAKMTTEKTLCIVPSHLFGIPSAMDKLCSFANERHIFTIEDAAQAMGGQYKERFLGTIGDVGFFSLGRGKNITCMSGGVIVTNNDQIASEIQKDYSKLVSPGFSANLIDLFKAILLSFFIRPTFYWLPAGLPFLGLGRTIYSTKFPINRLSGFQAALMTKWQERLVNSNRIRQDNGAFYASTIGRKGHSAPSIAYLRYPYLADSESHRDDIYRQLKDLGASLMYPSSINEIDELKDQFDASAYPAAASIPSQLLALPTHELLSENDREAIKTFIYRTFQSSSKTAGIGCPSKRSRTDLIHAGGETHR